MKLLKDRILRDADMKNGVIKVDAFLNHAVDTSLVRELAREWKRRFSGENITKILTVESSGIAIAAITAEEFGLPLVFARKASGRGLGDGYLSAKVVSLTAGVPYTVNADRRFITESDRVLIIDDILANGSSLRAMISLCREAGATVVGAGIAIEKSYLGQGAAIAKDGVRIEALAKIAAITDGGVAFED